MKGIDQPTIKCRILALTRQILICDVGHDTMKKIIIPALFIVAAAGGYLLLAPIFAVNRIPSIADEHLLLKETEQMVGDWLAAGRESEAFTGYPQQVPDTQWPDSVKQLRPVRVWMEPRGVTIVTSSGGIDSSFGIFVATKELDQGTLAKMNGVLKFRKISDRIYRYSEKE